jgi:hypothetical protein
VSLVGVGGVIVVLSLLDEPVELAERRGGISRAALWFFCLILSASWLSSSGSKTSGDDGLLAFAGGLPDGVEGGALFLPFRGVVDIEDGF